MSTDTSDVISDSLRRATRQRHNNEDEEVSVRQRPASYPDCFGESNWRDGGHQFGTR
jgi:hypothetical protein